MDSSKKDEGELTVAKRLLSRVAEEHKGTVDIVVYDALALGSGWINHCKTHNITPVIHVKDNNINSIKEAKAQVNQSTEKEIWYDEKRECEVKVYEHKLEMDDVEESLRFVKYKKKKSATERSQVMLVTSDFDIPLKTLYKIMHQRWDIENSVFNKMKTYGALEHCFIHHLNAIEAILYLMSIAYNLLQLFVFKRLSSKEVKKLTQKEIVRLLEKDLYRIRYSREYSFDTT